MIKTFGEFQFDERRKLLVGAGRTVRLSSQTRELLSMLLERPGELVTREEIRQRLWPGTHVEFEHSLDVAMSRLRAALGGESKGVHYIETVPKKGYRFVEPVCVNSNRRPVRRFRQFAKYAAVALFAAILAIMFVRSHYDKFVPKSGRGHSVSGND